MLKIRVFGMCMYWEGRISRSSKIQWNIHLDRHVKCWKLTKNRNKWPNGRKSLRWNKKDPVFVRSNANNDNSFTSSVVWTLLRKKKTRSKDTQWKTTLGRYGRVKIIWCCHWCRFVDSIVAKFWFLEAPLLSVKTQKQLIFFKNSIIPNSNSSNKL